MELEENTQATVDLPQRGDRVVHVFVIRGRYDQTDGCNHLVLVVTCLVVQPFPKGPAAAPPTAVKTLIVVPRYLSMSITLILTQINEGAHREQGPGTCRLRGRRG